ncbi:hypothetical protein CH278_01945 [Rhodococcus sp. 05-2254-5]|uniref:hypothetical protein n=1 Tax=unclassified Rhodococcus (in: high G+C Gram-positive bacteria) TaxID=192944 RepID=UPI000B9B70B0|nr:MULTISPECIES: hypothetical protein [unclassified Rhodococcus (in: high G+C Gram-positive bacteria)]OZE39071.1 hypothetical protein CH278_01945 [Rhodococcus sp. 05-2254-5]OZE59012.1 hypothetical protein CH269_08440 [Rhodococcus sp. 05-2254-1]
MTNRPSLTELVETAAKRHNDASGRRLAEIAQAAKHDLSHATLNRIRTGKYKSRPSDATLEAIAFLAGVDNGVAYTAADAELEVGSDGPETAAADRRRRRLALDLALSADWLVWFVSNLDPDAPLDIDNIVDAVDSHITNAVDLAEDIFGGHEALSAAKDREISRTEQIAEFRRHAHAMGVRASSLNRRNQGAQPDYDLARRKGETESEWRRRTEIQPEDESQAESRLDGN